MPTAHPLRTNVAAWRAMAFFWTIINCDLRVKPGSSVTACRGTVAPPCTLSTRPSESR